MAGWRLGRSEDSLPTLHPISIHELMAFRKLSDLVRKEPNSFEIDQPKGRVHAAFASGPTIAGSLPKKKRGSRKPAE